jgi:NADPH:quinone reductase-like Zn-dependent oxidoreductase
MGTGFRLPRNRGIGLDAAGEVEAVGAGVTAFRPGDEVFGDLTRFGYGAFAEYACTSEQAWAHKPSSMSFEEAATVPQSGILALQNLRVRGRSIEPGDRVLVNGASGNVGPFAVQILKAWGAHVTGVASPGKLDLVRELGADEALDYTVDDYTTVRPRFDRIIDIAGKRSITANRRALRPGGTYVMVGGPGLRILDGLVRGPLVSLAGSRTMGLGLWWKPFDPADVAILLDLVASGDIRPVIDRRFPLEQTADALRYLDAKRARGKVVITI